MQRHGAQSGLEARTQDEAAWHLGWGKNTFGRRMKRARERFGLTQIAYAPDGKTLVGIELFGGLHILDGNSGKHLRKFAPPRSMDGPTISPDGKTIATFSGGPHTFDLWDAASGKLLHSFEGHRGGITSLAFSANGETLFSSAEMTEHELLSWDTTTGKPRGQIYADPTGGGYRPHALSPNGKLLAARNLTSLELLDPASRKVVRTCEGSKNLLHIAAMAWSANVKTLGSSIPNDKIIHVWDPATGKLRRAIETKQSDVGTLALSADGAMAAVGGHWDGVVRRDSTKKPSLIRGDTCAWLFSHCLPLPLNPPTPERDQAHRPGVIPLVRSCSTRPASLKSRSRKPDIC